MSCEQLFEKYAGNKGFMNETDFELYWADSGHRVNTMGRDEIGGAHSAFLGANTSKNNKLSKSEFCHWLRHAPQGERY